jgi:MHS family alpha-ketoglutarate permease-like MFS transporter
MLLTIMLMAGGSLIIAILPTYAAVGWLAPILLLFARIAQGMSLGGEVSSASAYLAEIAPPNRRGRYSSFFYISTGIAVLLASLLGAFLASTLADDQLASVGVADPVPDRRGPRPRRAVDAPRHGRDRAVREERRQG